MGRVIWGRWGEEFQEEVRREWEAGEARVQGVEGVCLRKFGGWQVYWRWVRRGRKESGREG